jgi:hypothetical protein
MLHEDIQDTYRRLRLKLTLLMALVVALGAGFLFGWYLYTTSDNVPAWREVEFNHFPATVGLPVAAVGAFLIVSMFRTTQGTITIRVVGVSFEGASGPIIMWVFCFLAMTVAIKILW